MADSRHLEAFLFEKGGPVSRLRLRKVLQCTNEELTALVADLHSQLNGRAVQIVETPQAVQLTTTPVVASFLAEHISSEPTTLSRVLMETLAVVAYLGPVSVRQISDVRGVHSARAIRQLVALGLVAPVGTDSGEETLGVTTRCLQLLGVGSLSELPDYGTVAWPEQSS